MPSDFGLQLSQPDDVSTPKIKDYDILKATQSG